MKKNFVISGTGCALVDYLYQPVDFDSNDFELYLSQSPGDGGLSPGKLVFTEELEKFAGQPYSLIRDRITKGKPPVGVNTGGPSIVSLIHAAQMLHNKPAQVYFSGARGNDAAAKVIEEKIQKTPLKTANYKISEKFTPFTDVLADPGFDQGHGERAFINNIGAAWDFYPEDLPDSFFESDMVVFGGTALVPNIHQNIDSLLQKAKSKGIITVVNTVYDFINEKNDPTKPWPMGQKANAYPRIDLLITDREEALRHSGCTTAQEALRWFAGQGAGAAIITQGPEEVLFYANSDLFEKQTFTALPVSARAKREVKQQAEKPVGDTTGCGDNFTGGVIASLADQIITDPSCGKFNLKEAVALGIASGGFACFFHGGTLLEDYPGQKAEKLDAYHKDYLQQVSR